MCFGRIRGKGTTFCRITGNLGEKNACHPSKISFFSHEVEQANVGDGALLAATQVGDAAQQAGKLGVGLGDDLRVPHVGDGVGGGVDGEVVGVVTGHIARRAALGIHGHGGEQACPLQAVEQRLAQRAGDVIVLDQRVEGEGGLPLLEALDGHGQHSDGKVAGKGL